jgi:hypothetical protein
MPIVASLIKIAALVLALLCVDIRPMSVETGSDSKSRHSKCRIYFGCIPSGHPADSAANDEGSSR